jgi:hypothetical protein
VGDENGRPDGFGHTGDFDDVLFCYLAVDLCEDEKIESLKKFPGLQDHYLNYKKLDEDQINQPYQYLLNSSSILVWRP